MSNKVFVGPNVSDLDIGEKPTRISRVNILVDSEHQYTAGDDTGRTLEKTVPWGSQAMADAILSAVKNYDYQPFTGTDALLDPAAEIGDGINVGGVYSVLVQKDIAFGKLTTTDIAAPGTDEIEDEYPYMSRAQRQEQRKLAQTRSLITKTADQIRAEVKNEVDGLSSSLTVELKSITQRVEGLGGQYTELKTTLDGVTVTDSGGTTRIKGSSIETGSIAVGAIRANQVQLSGAISWWDLDSSTQSTIDTASQNASSAKTAASDAQNTVNSWRYYGGTYIDGNMLATNTVTAYKLQGETIDLATGGGAIVGQLTLAYTGSGAGLGINSYYGGIRLKCGLTDYGECAGNFWVDAYGGSIGITSDGFQTTCNCRPNITSTYYLGTSTHKWSAVYASTGQIQTSDANVKRDIEPLPDKYVDMIDGVKIVRYKLNDGTSNRFHVGFVSQQVEEAMNAAGVDSTEFGGYVKDKDEDGNDIYMLRYEEFIPILLAKIRKLEKRIDALQR